MGTAARPEPTALRAPIAIAALWATETAPRATETAPRATAMEMAARATEMEMAARATEMEMAARATETETAARVTETETAARATETETAARATAAPETGDGDSCEAPADYTDCDGVPGSSLTADPFQAIGLNCPGGTDANSIQVSNAVMNAANVDTWRVVTQFGTPDSANPGTRYNDKLWAANLTDWTSPDMEVIKPNTSTAILALSTGVVAAADANGVVVEANSSQTGNGDNGNNDVGGLPAPLSAAYGSNGGAGGTPFNGCDGINDCSDSLYNHWFVNGWNNPNDALWMSFDVTVPPGTFGYVFDFAYFSSEYPNYYNTQYNDLFIAWQVSEVYTGNVTFVNDAPLTITSLEDAGAFAYKDAAPELAGTGFEGNAGTGWFAARGAVNPGETANITFFIADMADNVLATGVLIDNFRWECEGCIPSEIDDCGLTPLPE
jgi:hypothetical protein